MTGLTDVGRALSKGEKMGFILEERDKKAGRAAIIVSPGYPWLHTQNHPEKHTNHPAFTAQLGSWWGASS